MTFVLPAKEYGSISVYLALHKRPSTCTQILIENKCYTNIVSKKHSNFSYFYSIF